MRPESQHIQDTESSQNAKKLKTSEKHLFFDCLNMMKSIGLLKVLTCKTVSRFFLLL